MASFLAWLSANGGALALGGVVIIVLFAILNPDKVKQLIESIKSGDLATTVSTMLRQSTIVRKAQTAKGEAGNIVCYTEMKIASVNVVNNVDPDKQAETAAAFTTILTNIATAKVTPPEIKS